jgi:hypothetical protein
MENLAPAETQLWLGLLFLVAPRPLPKLKQSEGVGEQDVQTTFFADDAPSLGARTARPKSGGAGIRRPLLIVARNEGHSLLTLRDAKIENPELTDKPGVPEHVAHIRQQAAWRGVGGSVPHCLQTDGICICQG